MAAPVKFECVLLELWNVCSIIHGMDVVVTRRCGKCTELRPIEQFPRRGRGFNAWCNPCRKIYDANWHATNRERFMAAKRKRTDALVAWVQTLKDNPCIDCGLKFHPAAMTFDHLPGSKKRGDVSTIARSGASALLRAEIEKCELVCANCHAVRTFARRQRAKAA